MSEAVKTLPSLFAVLIGATAFIIGHNPIALLLFGLIAAAAYFQREAALGTIAKWGYVFFAGISGALFFKGLLLAMFPAALLSALICVFCTLVLYTRMKV